MSTFDPSALMSILQGQGGNSPQQPQQDQTQPPANNAQNAGPVKAGLRHVLASMLGNFSYGAGQSMIKASGGETDAEQATRLAATAHLNAQTKLIQQQATMLPYQPQGPNGPTVYLPPKMYSDLEKQRIANQGKVDAKRFISTPQGLYDTQTKDANGFPSLTPNSGSGVTITPGMTSQYPIPKEFVGKQIKLTDLAALERGQAFNNAMVQTDTGPVVVPKAGPNMGQATPVTVNGRVAGNPGIATVRAGAAAKAANTPFQTYDADGNLITTSAAKAIATGAPSAQTEFSQYGPTAQTRTAGQFAGTLVPKIDLIKGEIDRLDQQGKLGPIQGRWNDFLAGKVGASDPDYAQLRTELSLFASGAARAHTSRTGIEAINYFKSLLAQPGASAEQLKSQLDAVRPYLSGYQGAGQFAPNGNPGVPPTVKSKMPPKSTGFDWGSAPKAQK